jgi:hypothetical protein
MVTTRAAHKRNLDALEADPLRRANEPLQKRSKREIKQQQSYAFAPHSEQPALYGVPPKSKHSSTPIKPKMQGDALEFQPVSARLRSAARKEQVDQSLDEQKTHAVLRSPKSVKTIPSSDVSAGSGQNTLRSSTPLNGPSPRQLFLSTTLDSVEVQPEDDDDKDEDLVTADIQQTQEQSLSKATRSITIPLMGALIALVCAFGWYFSRFIAFTAQAARTACLQLVQFGNVLWLLTVIAMRFVWLSALNGLWYVVKACVFAIIVMWSCLTAIPALTIGTTFLIALIITTLRVEATRKQQLSADVELAEADVLRSLMDNPNVEHESNQLRELFKGKLQSSEQQTRFVRLVWPNVALHIELNPKIRVRDVAVTQGVQVHDTVVYKWNAIE